MNLLTINVMPNNYARLITSPIEEGDMQAVAPRPLHSITHNTATSIMLCVHQYAPRCDRQYVMCTPIRPPDQDAIGSMLCVHQYAPDATGIMLCVHQYAPRCDRQYVMCTQI